MHNIALVQVFDTRKDLGKEVTHDFYAQFACALYEIKEVFILSIFGYDNVPLPLHLVVHNQVFFASPHILDDILMYQIQGQNLLFFEKRPFHSALPLFIAIFEQSFENLDAHNLLV